jgi:hypothetical protein
LLLVEPTILPKRIGKLHPIKQHYANELSNAPLDRIRWEMIHDIEKYNKKHGHQREEFSKRTHEGYIAGGNLGMYFRVKSTYRRTALRGLSKVSPDIRIR